MSEYNYKGYTITIIKHKACRKWIYLINGRGPSPDCDLKKTAIELAKEDVDRKIKNITAFNPNP